MNSFALLQDDVEDATDLSVPSKDAPAADTPADSVHDARSAPAQDPAPEPDADAPQPDGEEKPRPQPKEKDLTLEEYLAQKAQKSSSLTSLSKGARKPNDGISSGFENMSLLSKDDPANRPAKDSLMGAVPVKEQHENKALKDSTQAAVAKNAEIQSFFKRDPASDRRSYSGPRRGGDSRRGGYDGRRGGRGGAPRDSDSRQRFDDDRSQRYEGRGGKGDSRGGRFEGRGGRSEGRGGRYERGTDRDGRRDNRGGYGRGRGHSGADSNGHRSYGNAPKAPIVPNVDDTAAFPSL